MVEPGERGATRIADRVVAKIASQAAREALRGDAAEAVEAVDAVAVGDGGLTDVTVARPNAVAAVRGGVARVRVAVELGYPSDIGAHCGAVRRQVIERVSELTGMEVPEVAVTVERLHVPQWERPERKARRGRDRVR
ncbi:MULTISPECIES: Asp23/Gls24 family envelope stress response protein [Streptomyces]|uniref:Asp23/Gls24 family envelope stress response protein n=1 Tax=Streptomyces TaxID=1883 RepID=UPI000852D474|nr:MULTISPECIES: Asp23/Gls24 family envelope stress response protein [unclassified Streptomyces]MCC4317018.1 Asp23/Gls24 family envelope stress response protein [Streptomyces malaysiensis]MCD9593055.1 Asp23/Gls24 family envelope stress response protein [Streptomyces sp. 8ZJF_21]MCM3808031.1 Asp23/Gls24 family envelope stress response protein [Streptomyces sp. DR7-3]